MRDLGHAKLELTPDGRAILTVVVNVLPELNTAYTRRSKWVAAKNAKEWRQRIVALVQGPWKGRAPLPRAKVTFVRCAPRECDYDNWVMACKPVLDAFARSSIRKEKVLIRAGVIYDDCRPYLPEPPVYLPYEKVPKGEEAIRIAIEQLPNPPDLIEGTALAASDSRCELDPILPELKPPPPAWAKPKKRRTRRFARRGAVAEEEG